MCGRILKLNFSGCFLANLKALTRWNIYYQKLKKIIHCVLPLFFNNNVTLRTLLNKSNECDSKQKRRKPCIYLRYKFIENQMLNESGAHLKIRRREY
jgi:hypothetical protein